MTLPITIEQLEALAAQVENDNATEHERLNRLCRAMARILAGRQRELFVARATSITDEAGHFDGSYPPKEECHGRSRALLRVRRYTVENVPTSGGFYHDFREQTTDVGCYVSLDGSLWGCDRSGTGRLGQYAAHPGECNRDITLDWHAIEPTLDDLRAAEAALRDALATYLRGAA